MMGQSASKTKYVQCVFLFGPGCVIAQFLAKCSQEKERLEKRLDIIDRKLERMDDVDEREIERMQRREERRWERRRDREL